MELREARAATERFEERVTELEGANDELAERLADDEAPWRSFGRARRGPGDRRGARAGSRRGEGEPRRADRHAEGARPRRRAGRRAAHRAHQDAGGARPGADGGRGGRVAAHQARRRRARHPGGEGRPGADPRAARLAWRPSWPPPRAPRSPRSAPPSSSARRRSACARRSLRSRTRTPKPTPARTPIRTPSARRARRRLARRDLQVRQRELHDPLEGGRRHGAAVDVAARRVDHHRHEQARVLRRREADERGDEVGLRVAALDRLLAPCRSCRPACSPRPGASCAVPPGPSTPSSMCDTCSAVAPREHALAAAAGRPPRRTAGASRRRSRSPCRPCAIWIGVTAMPWPIGMLPIDEPE